MNFTTKKPQQASYDLRLSVSCFSYLISDEHSSHGPVTCASTQSTSIGTNEGDHNIMKQVELIETISLLPLRP